MSRPILPSSPPPAFRESGRRLPDADVRAVFECLHYKTPPPPHLPFKIIPVGPTGKKLSPPSYEYDCGLYVLLRPLQKKKKRGVVSPPPRAPSHLEHLVENFQPEDEVCPWALSGPQFPVPSALQQRYCYPRKKAEYGNKVGAKRAANRGVPTSMRDDESKVSYSSSPSKRRRLQADVLSPPRQVYRTTHEFHLPVFQHPSTPLAAARRDLSSSHLQVTSPLSFDSLSPPSPTGFASSAFVTPVHSDPVRRSCQPLHSEASLLTPSPFQNKNSVAEHNIQQSPLHRSSSVKGNVDETVDGRSDDPFPFDICSSWHDVDDSCLNDPLLNIMLKPSHSIEEITLTDGLWLSSPTSSTSDLSPSFLTQLDTLSQQLRDRITLASSSQDATLMTNQLVEWARKLAENPPTWQDRKRGSSVNNSVTDDSVAAV